MNDSVIVIRFDEKTGRPVVQPGSVKQAEVTDAWLQYLLDTTWDAALEEAAKLGNEYAYVGSFQAAIRAMKEPE